MIVVEKNETSWIGSFWLVNVVLLIFCVCCIQVFVFMCMFVLYIQKSSMSFVSSTKTNTILWRGGIPREPRFPCGDGFLSSHNSLHYKINPLSTM